MRETNAEGKKDQSATIIGLMGEYKIAPGIKIGALLNQYKSTNDAFDISMAAFGLSLGMSR